MPRLTRTQARRQMLQQIQTRSLIMQDRAALRAEARAKGLPEPEVTEADLNWAYGN